jgi:uncharacterized protein (UPF0332 family)
MAKAVRATASAKILLDTGDVDGACDRAYYAMFNAARAALLASGAPVQADISRTHSGLIAAFSLHLVKPGQVSVDLGRALNKVEEPWASSSPQWSIIEICPYPLRFPVPGP